jgi:hypothetical protein
VRSDRDSRQEAFLVPRRVLPLRHRQEVGDGSHRSRDHPLRAGPHGGQLEDLPPGDRRGVPEIDLYAEALRGLLFPLLPKTVVLWALRTGLIVMFAPHIHAAYALTVINHRARPDKYQGLRQYQEANYASRTMRWSGTIFLAFLIFHLDVLHVDHRHAALEIQDSFPSVEGTITFNLTK